MEKQTGKVKWFDPKKGFGFITPSNGGEDVFVHQSSILSDGFRSLSEEQEIEFEMERDGNGKLSAKNVTGPGGASVVAQRTIRGGGFGGGFRG
mmetsp:Transcript_12930/g.10993  ORF Transcript_12930/g.10993 Transcript_12930/m.10993 type:complete len:93 (-) Transcript_12930:96-374(-)